MVAVALLLVLPVAAATAPFNNLSNAASPDGQSITDIAMDGTGRYTSVVVVVDTTSQTVPGGSTCIPTPITPCTNTPGTSTGVHRDVYPCDFGEPVTRADEPTKDQGNGCYGIQHDSSVRSTASGATQATAMLSFTTSANQLVAYYAVGGPGPAVGLWNYESATHKFEKNIPIAGEVALNVSLARVANDRVRVVAGTAGTGSTFSGHVFVFDMDGNVVWSVNLTDAQGGAVRASALASAIGAPATVVGVSGGLSNGALLFFDPTGGPPTLGVRDMHPLDTRAPVNNVAVAKDGSAAVAATTNGVWYVPLLSGAPAGDTPWNAQLNDGAVAVTVTGDGSRFAAASGNKVFFYERSTSGAAAQTRFAAYDTGEGVADVAYSNDGTLLVAVAGNHVYGFGPDSNQPIWIFDATDATRGGLDGPMRKVAVSDTGERVVVAGRTRVMAYANVYSATAAFNVPSTSIVPGVDLVLPLTLENTGNLPDTYTVRAGQQNSAALQTNLPQRVTLNPDGKATINVTFRAVTGTTPGDLLGDIRVVSENRTRLATLPQRSSLASEVAAPHVTLSVPRAIALRIESPESKLLLRQAGEQSVPITVHNDGNAEGVVNMTTEQITSRGSSWVIKWSPAEQVRIPAGQSAVVNMQLSAPADAVSGERNYLTVHAKEGSFADATVNLTAYVDAQFRADLTALNNSLEFKPGDVRTLAINVRNAGNTDDIYNITANVTPPAYANDWRVTVSNDQINVPQGATRTVTLTLRAQIASPRDATVLVKAISQASPNNEEYTYRLDLIAKPADQPANDNKLLPGPSPLVGVAVLALVALARRLRGGQP